MKKITLLLLFLLTNYITFSQCDPVVSVSPVLCSDPANGIYIVDPTQPISLSIQDGSGVDQMVTWSPRTNLYLSAAGTTQIPNNFALPEVYFANASSNREYDLFGQFSLAGCGNQVESITIVTGGFTYDDFCLGAQVALADIDILGNNGSSLTWYDDAAGTNQLPITTYVEGGSTYYVDLGISGCSQLFPVDITYRIPLPDGGTAQRFCSDQTWINAGITTEDGDVISDLNICGENLSWYSDAAGTTPIFNPNTQDLVDGQSYYVTQTINGCESDLLEVQVTEQECACFKNPGFQDQSGNFDSTGFTFYSQDNGTASQIEACKGTSYILPSVNQYTTTIDQYNYSSSNDMVNFASPGLNSILQANGVNIPTTSPFACSEKSIKLNDDDNGSRSRTTMVKEFVAGEVMSFDFMFMMNDPGHPTTAEQPFVTFQLYDEAGNLVQNRCIIADPENCIFNTINNASAPGGGSIPTPVVYTEWSCVKLNTIELQGQAARLEVTVGDCIYTVHWGTAYFDNFYVGDDGPGVCDDSAFGYMAINPLNLDGNNTYEEYEECSLVEQPQEENCASAIPVANPSFPIEVCGTYANPTGGNLAQIKLDILQNGTNVGTINSAIGSGSNAYCFTLNESDLSVPPYGYFTFDGEIRFDMNCGSPYSFYAQAQSNGFKICPIAECPTPFEFCTSGGVPGDVDLTSRESEVLGRVDPADYGDYSITYYTDEQGAMNQNAGFEITGNLTQYPVSTSETVYVRLDYDYTALGISPISDCFDVVPLEIIVGQEPNLPATISDYTICDEGGGTANFDLTTKESDFLTNISDPSTVTWLYFDNLADAQANNSSQAIGTPSQYPSSGGTIYVRVENNGDGCSSIAQFNIVVSSFPSYNVSSQPFVECEDVAGTGKAEFDLSSIANTIVGSSSITTTFYGTQAEADAGGSAGQLSSPYENINANNETIFILLSNAGCDIVESIELQVTPAPTANDPLPYSVCEDVAGSGSGTFTLSNLETEITGGASGVTLDFYSQLADAQSGTGTTLPTSYTGSTATIYARVAVGSDCFDTATVSLVVEDRPDLPASVSALAECDENGSGDAEFNLTLNESAILANVADPSNYTLTYSENGTIIPASDLTTYQSGSATIDVEVEGTNGCTSSISFDLEVNPLPTYNVPVALDECDQGAQDGFTVFDLNDAIAQISTGSTTSISFYETQAGAEAADPSVEPSLPLSYTNGVAPNDQIYVRIESASGCYQVDTLDLNVIGAPNANTPAPLEVCDDNNDGSGSFSLSTLDGTITGNDPDLSVSYYSTQAGANTADASQLLSSPYPSATATVYARIESATISCYNTVEVSLVLQPSPDLPTTIAALEACDENETGEMAFDLEDRRADVLANVTTPSDYTVRYYDANGTEITGADINNYMSASATITVEVESSNGCLSETSFDLVVNSLPSFNTPAPLIICDEGQANGQATFDLTNATTQITGNDPNLEVLYYEQQADAETGANNDLGNSYINGIPYAQTIYVRIRNVNTNCVVVTSLDLEVNEAPAAYTPALFEYCDDDNDGEGLFILTDLDSEITGGVSGVTVSYHRTQADADNDVQPLNSPFANTEDYTQTIYARVETPGVACYNTVEVDLQVLDSPDLVASENLDGLAECDDNQSGSALFDLTDMEAAILANETTPSDFTVSYYASAADLASGNTINVPSAYSGIAPSQVIYVLVEGGNGCQDDTSFEITVNSLPTIFPPTPLELCDVNNSGDEQEEFNLTDATLEINGGDTSIDVKYYETQSDADNDTNALTSPYENTSNNQTIYIRAEDSDTGCFVSTGYTLTLTVNPLPSPEIPDDPIEVCDVDNDGIAEFDLGNLTSEIIGGEPNIAITYHRTQASANSGGNPIDTSLPYGVSGSGSQMIYVRATNTNTDCFVTGELELISVASPEIANLEDLYVCDDNADGFAVFDLTQNNPNIIGSQNSADLIISYHTTQNDAETGDNAIIVPSMYTNTVNGQTIYVRLENENTSCIDVFDATSDNTFTLNVEALPAIVEPTPLQLCDDDYNNVPVAQTIFNLTSKEGEITGQALPPNTYEFNYYANEQDFIAGNLIADPTSYENVSTNQEIYVEVINTATRGLCSDVITLTLEVLPLPSPSITDPDELRIEECDDNNDGIAANPFDLTEAGDKISGSENVELSYYKTENAAEDGDTSSAEYISDPTAYVNEPSYNSVNDDGLVVQEIYVRVDSGVNGNFCYVIVPIEIMVVRAPVLSIIQPDEFGYTLCEDGNSGQATLFLDDIANNVYDNTATDPDPSNLIPLLDQDENDDLDLSNYTITYYESVSDAEDGINPLSSGDLASNDDLVYVRIEYEDTGCFNTGAIGAIRITVEPRPGIQEVDLTEVVCSDEQGGSTATVDLTQFNDQINPGAPADTQVVYYANMNDYMAGNSIDGGVLTAYTTTDNPQTIIAEVIDTNTLCESAVYATITVEVDDRPVVDISGYSGIICEDLDPSTPTEGGDYDPIIIETGITDTFYSFVWSRNGSVIPGEDEASLAVTQSGTYTVEVTNDVTGCSSTSSASFTQSTPPEFTVTPLTVAFEGEHALSIAATGEGDYEFRIDDGPWMEAGADGTLTIEGIAAGNHFVYGRDRNGCGITVNTISFMDYPKFFTPNEDGYNDRWNIIGLGEENAGANIYIFDRYGKLLKQLSPTSEGWDGTYNGNVMPSGDYWFRIEYLELQPDGEFREAEFKANFTLKR